MTFREKLQQEHPEYMGEEHEGGCKGCPEFYGYEEPIESCPNESFDCQACWDREIPERNDQEVTAIEQYIRKTLASKYDDKKVDWAFGALDFAYDAKLITKKDMDALAKKYGLMGDDNDATN